MTALKNSKSKFVFDVDSTVWPAEKEYDRAALDLYGKRFYSSEYDWYDVPDLVARYGPGYRRIFEAALGPASLKHREVYPGVVEAVRTISENGYGVLFFTHHHAPNSMRGPLRSWLQEVFDVDLTLYIHTSRVRKTGKSIRAGGVALVDDKPDTLGDAVAAGLYTMTKVHPWNVQLLKATPQIHGFEKWSEVVPILRKDGML